MKKHPSRIRGTTRTSTSASATTRTSASATTSASASAITSDRRQLQLQLQCPTCGITTHKKGGGSLILFGRRKKKSIPITVEGRVYQGRCLACDPFPSGHGGPPTVAVAAVAAATAASAVPTTTTTTTVNATVTTVSPAAAAQGQDEPVVSHTTPIHRLGNAKNNTPTTNNNSSSQQPPSPPPPTTTKPTKPAAAVAEHSRHRQSITTDDAQDAPEDVEYQESEEKNHTKNRNGNVQKIPPTRSRNEQDRTTTTAATATATAAAAANNTTKYNTNNTSNINYDIRGVLLEDTMDSPSPFTLQQLPPSRVAVAVATPGRAASKSKAKPTGVPKTLEVVRRIERPPRTSSSSNHNRNHNHNHTATTSGMNTNSASSTTNTDDHSVVSAITMDIHLFQSFGGGDDTSFDEDHHIDATEYGHNDNNNLLPPPPTSYQRSSRPGPEQRSSSGRKNNPNTGGGEGDSHRRRRRRRSFNNTNNTNSGGNWYDSKPSVIVPPASMARNDEYANGTRTETAQQVRSIPSSSPAAAAAAAGVEADPYDSSDHDNVPNTKRVSNINVRSNTTTTNENVNHKRINNHPLAQTQTTQPWRITSSSITYQNTQRSSQTNGAPAMVLNDDDDDDDFPSFIMDDNDYTIDEYDYAHNNLLRRQQQQDQQQHYRQSSSTAMPQANVTPTSSTSSSGPQFNNSNCNNNTIGGANYLTKGTTTGTKNTMITDEEQPDTVNDMPGILRCLNLEECNPDIREQALCKLINIMQSTSQSHYDGGDRERCMREFVLENDVIEAVTKSMWADMEIVEVQEAAMNVLLFIGASVDIAYTGVGGRDSSCEQQRHISNHGNSNNLLSQNESVCDSILFTMQNHVAVHGIQLKGSLIFASLAAAGSSNDNNNSNINNNFGSTNNNADGSLSGAMTMILNAMSNHGDSRPVRKAGLQALHHQCLLSNYAEDNKRNFVESKLGNGMPAIDLIIYAMEELQKDVVAMEWACQLCWCLTANEDSLKQIEHTSLHEGTMTICQHYMTNPVGVGLVEASIGTIANLAFLGTKRNEMINVGAVELVLDGLRYHGEDFGICYEAALALENFALPPYLPDVSSMLLKSEAIPLLIQGLKTFIDYPKYVIQGIRALTGIAARCDEAKGRIGSPEILSIVHESSHKYASTDVLEICSVFIATLAMGEAASVSDFMIEHGVVDILLFAMECSHEERVQDAACLALRNLSCRIEKPEELLKGGTTSKFIVGAMDAHRNSVSIQTNACCIFLNFLSNANQNEFDNFNPKIITCITKAMQSHIESGDLLELACGALWNVADRFEDQKVFVGTEAIDVVACAMVMHPGTTSTLEKACGLLSNLSAVDSLAKHIAKAQGVSIVSEVMRNNASSIVLLEFGCLTLKNIILVCPSYAQDGAVVISTLVMAMNENVGSASFVKEACDVLWVLASENENIRCKVLALDGISILMKCLEQNSNHPEVETSALGAFNQLAKANNQKIL